MGVWPKTQASAPHKLPPWPKTTTPVDPGHQRTISFLWLVQEDLSKYMKHNVLSSTVSRVTVAPHVPFPRSGFLSKYAGGVL